jgi:hypothetical protein
MHTQRGYNPTLATLELSVGAISGFSGIIAAQAMAPAAA